MFDIPDSLMPIEDFEKLGLLEQKFHTFIFDIYDHFNLVVIKKLGWDPIDVKITQGTNNVVIGFSYLDARYIFRVPKYGIRQLKTVMCIRRILGGKPYFIDVIYYDDKCLIERFVNGKFLDKNADSEGFIQLAKVMTDIHNLSGENFGPLKYKNIGIAESFQSYYLHNIDTIWDANSPYLNFESNKLDELKKYWYSVLLNTKSEAVICHGDLWHNNIFYCNNNQLVTLIDWDRCGIYHREKDLRFLISKEITEEQRSSFYAHYPYDIDEILLYWYNLTMQLKYCDVDDIQQFIDAADSFLVIMNKKLQLTNNNPVS